MHKDDEDEGADNDEDALVDNEEENPENGGSEKNDQNDEWIEEDAADAVPVGSKPCQSQTWRVSLVAETSLTF